MVGMFKTTVRRLLEQTHLDCPWWSYACKFGGRMIREKILGCSWTWPFFGLFGQVVGIWKGRDKESVKSLDGRGAVGYFLDLDVGKVVQLITQTIGSNKEPCPPQE